jgi:hypothetical protein
LPEEFKSNLPPVAAASPPALLPLTTLLNLFTWYRQNLCGQPFSDPRGFRVCFEETDFVHLIKLKDKYGKEPRNARRAQELSWARTIVESPTMIVPNWQVMGRANPGDAYIKSFINESGTHHRVLICGHAGRKRRVVTIFARDRFTNREITPVLWP